MTDHGWIAMAAGTVARPKVLYSGWRREHGSGTFKHSLGQPRVSHVSAIHQGLAVHGDRAIVCSCGLVSVPFVTTALLVRLSFIAWVRWMQYAIFFYLFIFFNSKHVRLRIVSYISRLPSDSELLVLHLRVRVKIAVEYVYVYLPTEHPLQSDSALGYRWKSVPPNGRTPTIPPGKFDINRPYHNLDQTPASTARASAVIPVSPSSSPPGRPGA
ncbi:hypothetical protein GE21DRAFT_1344274 [Neurospora crassa]|nr:hypothetical protein GE21DRAFT_1344274 [Neurospora crassa]